MAVTTWQGCGGGAGGGDCWQCLTNVVRGREKHGAGGAAGAGGTQVSGVVGDELDEVAAGDAHGLLAHEDEHAQHVRSPPPAALQERGAVLTTPRPQINDPHPV